VPPPLPTPATRHQGQRRSPSPCRRGRARRPPPCREVLPRRLKWHPADPPADLPAKRRASR
jgi:hypothetical protein